MLPSAILSADDDPGRPSRDMIELSLRVVREAMDADLSDLSRRLPRPPLWPDVWPGEHYRLLAGMVRVLQPRMVVEIGTATGLSALALKKYLPPGGQVITFDIIPWNQYPDSVLVGADFANHQLLQIVADLTRFEQARHYAEILGQADFLFVDAAKDGRMEAILLDHFSAVGLKEGAWLLFDDIRLQEMIGIWRSVALPKLDLTSFGHWSGSGLIQWTRTRRWSAW